MPAGHVSCDHDAARHIADRCPIRFLAATSTQIAVVQISLWLSVIMIFVLSAVIYSLGGMDYQTDTLLFQKSKDM